MKSYRLKINAFISLVGILSLLIFSATLYMLHMAEFKGLGEILMHYGFIIAPITLLWVWLESSLWHSKFVQKFRKSLNISPDLRGRWEGTIHPSTASEPLKFVLEIKQTLTMLKLYAYTENSRSHSIVVDIAADELEENFTLCFLWEGEVKAASREQQSSGKFHGYTMLAFHEYETPKILKGNYFTDLRPVQSNGIIDLTFTGHQLKRKF